jgi:hypothetical protein
MMIHYSYKQSSTSLCFFFFFRFFENDLYIFSSLDFFFGLIIFNLINHSNKNIVTYYTKKVKDFPTYFIVYMRWDPFF